MTQHLQSSGFKSQKCNTTKQKLSVWSLSINCARYLTHTGPFHLKQTTLHTAMCSRHACILALRRQAGRTVASSKHSLNLDSQNPGSESQRQGLQLSKQALSIQSYLQLLLAGNLRRNMTCPKHLAERQFSVRLSYKHHTRIFRTVPGNTLAAYTGSWVQSQYKQIGKQVGK